MPHLLAPPEGRSTSLPRAPVAEDDVAAAREVIASASTTRWAIKCCRGLRKKTSRFFCCLTQLLPLSVVLLRLLTHSELRPLQMEKRLVLLDSCMTMAASLQACTTSHTRPELEGTLCKHELICRHPGSQGTLALTG